MSSPQPLLLDEQAPDQIRSCPCSACYVCGTRGEPLYENLSDRLFGATGTWNLKRCPNPACGLLWLDPMPVKDDIAKAYGSYYTHQDGLPPGNLGRRIYSMMRNAYLRSEYGYLSVRCSRWAQLLAPLIYMDPPRRAGIHLGVFWLKCKRNGRLLEVGCGSGAMLKSMRDLGWQVEGVDFDPAAVEQARKKGLTVHLGALIEQRLPGSTFDAIVASHLIEHVPDPIETLRECHRLLKPGGLLVLVTPNARSWGHRLYRADWRGLEPPRHLHIFTRSSLVAACAQAGFSPGGCQSIVRSSTILLESRMLRRTGKADSAQHPLWMLLWKEVTGFFQWAVSLVDHEAGEEIVLISSK